MKYVYCPDSVRTYVVEHGETRDTVHARTRAHEGREFHGIMYPRHGATFVHTVSNHIKWRHDEKHGPSAHYWHAIY